MKLHPYQRQALELLRLNPCHLLVVAATGSGKSLVFERQMQLQRVPTLIVSPLISLARQQAQHLRKVGFKVALTVGGETVVPESDSEVWVTSPESLETPHRRRFLDQWRPQLLVVDECHCIDEWGDRFRPAFAGLPQLLQTQAIPKSIWLTATLTSVARKKLRSAVPGLRELGEFSLPSSLSVQVRQVGWSERLYFLGRWIGFREGAGIVFCQTRQFAERCQVFIHKIGRKSAYYHAGLSQEERRSIENALQAGELDCVVATSAFGMGMNYPQLRWVAILQTPLSMLALAQAIGRVARAGIGGAALVLWDPQDFTLNRWAYDSTVPVEESEPFHLARFFERKGCRRRTLAEYFEVVTIAPTCIESHAAPCDYCLEVNK